MKLPNNPDSSNLRKIKISSPLSALSKLVLMLVFLSTLQISGWAQVSDDDIEKRDGVAYLKGKTTAYSGQVVNFYKGSSNKRSKMTYTKGKLEGLYQEWHSNGKLSYETTYKSGKINGRFTMYYENGNKKRTGILYGRTKSGTYTAWFSNGVKKFEGTYENGKKEGTFIYWYKNRQMESLERFTNDQENGLCQWWNENGKLEFEERYENGELKESKEY